MSNSGSGWFDPFADDANWGNGIRPSAVGSGANAVPSSRVGLFGGQYADMMANVARSRLAEQLFGGPADLSGDGTGLRPSVTIAPYLPQLVDPNLQQVFGLTGRNHALLPSAGAAPQFPDARSDGSLVAKPGGAPPVLEPLPLPIGKERGNAIPLGATAPAPGGQDVSLSGAPQGRAVIDMQQRVLPPNGDDDGSNVVGAAKGAGGKNGLPSIDSSFIDQWEIDPRRPTALTHPKPSNSGGYSTTGVSSGGFDLGAHSPDQIKRLPLNDEDRKTVLPLAGLQGEKLDEYLNDPRNPLKPLSPEGVEILHQAGLNEAVARVQRLYDKESSSGLTFGELPEPARTALTSLAYQTRDWHTSRLWRYATSGQWDAAVNELQHYYDNSSNPPTKRDIARRQGEAGLIQGALNDGLLHNAPN